MIEVASHPANLGNWRSAPETPYYFEVFGETSPQVDLAYAQIQGPSDGASTAQQTTVAPVYEYWWTIGHGGDYDPKHHKWVRGDYVDHPDADPWNNLQDVAAHVYLFFPTWTGWRIKELSVQLKYLSPVRESESLLTEVARGWTQASPLISDASQLAGLFAPIPGAAAGAKEAATILDTLAKLKVNSVPPAGEYKWATMKVTYITPEGAMQGIAWELPAKMFLDLGGRLTGSVALSFIPASRQGGEAAAERAQLRPGNLQAHSVIHLRDGDTPDRWVPHTGYVNLRLTPIPLVASAPQSEIAALGQGQRVTPHAAGS